MSEQVWTAVDLYPESTGLVVAADEATLLREIVRTIGRDEFDEFVGSLAGSEATTVTYDDDPEDVLRVWSGERAGMDGGYIIGADWLVRHVEVATPDQPVTAPRPTEAEGGEAL